MLMRTRTKSGVLIYQLKIAPNNSDKATVRTISTATSTAKYFISILYMSKNIKCATTFAKNTWKTVLTQRNWAL